MFLRLMFAVFLLVPGVLWAQASNQPTEPELAQARAKFEEASRLYDLGEYQKALDGFRDAYLISGEPALLLNMGQCYRFLKKYDDAIRTYESFLRSSPNSEYQKSVEDLIAQIKDQQEKERAAAASQKIQPKPSKIPIDTTNLPQNPYIYYGAAGIAGIIGLAIGGKALGFVIDSRNNFEDDEILSKEQFQKARVRGVFADVFLVTTAVGALIGHRKAKQKKEAAEVAEAE